MSETCPKCGAPLHPDDVRQFAILGNIIYPCGTRQDADGVYESRDCLWKQLAQRDQCPTCGERTMEMQVARCSACGESVTTAAEVDRQMAVLAQRNETIERLDDELSEADTLVEEFQRAIMVARGGEMGEHGDPADITPAEAEREIAGLRGALETVEYVEECTDCCPGDERCPYCEMPRGSSHTRDCVIGAALSLSPSTTDTPEEQAK